LARVAGEQDRLVDEGSSLRNDVAEITGELARVASERDGAAREINSVRASLADVARERDGLALDKILLQSEMAVAKMERDCVVVERSSLQNNVVRLVDELARVESEREGLAGELDGARAKMADIREGARRSWGRGFVVEGGRPSTIPWRYLLTKKLRLRYIEYLLIVPLFVCPKFILPPTATSNPPPLPRSELAHFNEVFLVFLGLSADQNPLPKTMPPRHPPAVPAPDPAFTR
jgi:hypothetical protein